jgi:hypothetical protein
MSSGAGGTGAHAAEQAADTPEMRAGLAAEGDGLGAVEAVRPAGLGAARAAGSRPGARALAAVEAVAASLPRRR